MVGERIARGVGGLIGFGQEVYAHNKEKKASACGDDGAIQDKTDRTHFDEGLPSGDHSHEDDSSGAEFDEDEWFNNEAQRQLVRPEATKEADDAKAMKVEQFLLRYPSPTGPQTGRLSAPVMVPQRRPGTSTRGFVRAYAPGLASSNIDQEAFLDFMDALGQSIHGEGLFNVANLAFALSVLSYTISCGPSVIVHFSAMAVHLSIETGRRGYVNYQRNTFIDKMNEGFFQPRGLYAMFMSYDPDNNGKETVDFDIATWAAVSKQSDPDRSKVNKVVHSSTGKTLASQMPEVCPLVYPELDNATEEQKKNSFQRALAFTTDYNDRRSQALFAAHNPDSALKVEQKPFAGKYADPTTFEHSGVLGVLTGGRVDRSQKRRERRDQMRIARGRKPLDPGQISGLIGSVVKPIKKSLSVGVIYLLVVNMPTEAELAQAAAVEAKLKHDNPKWYEQFRL